MTDLAKQAHEKTAVGATGWIRPVSNDVDELERFKVVVIAAKIMQENHLIHLQDLHRESQTGKQYVDAIRFTRLV